ncbi:MAG: hypothetical protein R2754_04900 [Microthrixaceae bacterium]
MKHLRASAGWRDLAEQRLTRLNTRRFGLLAFFILFSVYLPTSLAFGFHHVDAFGNELTAWSLVRNGSPTLDGYGPFELDADTFQAGVPRLRSGRSGTVSQYPPGAALTAVPVYAAARVLGVDEQSVTLDTLEGQAVTVFFPPAWIGGLAGALSTALAGMFVCLTVGIRSSRTTALAAGLTFGLGTGAWMVASTDLWTHGPTMMWLAAAVYLAQTRRLKLSGAAFAMAVLIRPHTAIIAAAVGAAIALRRRSVLPLLELGIPATGGVLALLAYNRWAYGAWTLSGGYGDGFAKALTATDGSSVVTFARQVGWGLAHPVRGLVIYSPWLLTLLPVVREGWRRCDPVGRGAALGGLLYLAIQWRANWYSGGTGFWGYRYPLGPLAVSALLGVACWESLPAHGRLREWFPRLVIASGALQLAGFAFYTWL